MSEPRRHSSSARCRPGLRQLALLAGLWVLLSATGACAAELTGTVDRNVVAAGETFNYVLSLTGGSGRQPPDISPLSRDFNIVDRRRSSRSEMIDGKPTHIDQWVMTLLPKRLGTLTVPALSVDGATSTPERIQVIPAAPADDHASAPLFVRVATGAGPAFAQSEIPVTVRIYDSIGMLSGAMQKPMAEGAAFTPDGDQRSYFKTIGGRRYRVLEQSYLMRPQKSGVIEIPPLTLEATVPGFQGSSAGSDLPGLLGRGPGFPGSGPTERTEVVRSQPVSVTIAPRPAGATGWFLPAYKVTLRSNWSASGGTPSDRPPGKIEVGEMLTRTLTLEAEGATPNQLPPLAVTAVPDLRQYEDKSRSETSWIGGHMGARLEKVVSVMATRPGSFTLPAIRVSWWNLKTQKQEVAELPAETLTVQGGAGLAAAPPPSPATASTTATVGEVPADAKAPGRGLSWLADAVAGLGRMLARVPASLLRDGLAGLVTLGLLLLLFRGLWRRKPAPSLPSAHGPRRDAIDAAAASAALEAACKADDPVGAHAAYLSWSQRVDGTASTGAASASDPALAAALSELRVHLYGEAPGPWRGRNLLRAFRRAQRRRRHSQRSPRGARLAPLYPSAH